MKRIFNKDTRDYDVVPSENYGPNKMLVTDTDGNPRWVEAESTGGSSGGNNYPVWDSNNNEGFEAFLIERAKAMEPMWYIERFGNELPEAFYGDDNVYISTHLYNKYTIDAGLLDTDEAGERITVYRLCYQDTGFSYSHITITREQYIEIANAWTSMANR